MPFSHPYQRIPADHRLVVFLASLHFVTLQAAVAAVILPGN